MVSPAVLAMGIGQQKELLVKYHLVVAGALDWLLLPLFLRPLSPGAWASLIGRLIGSEQVAKALDWGYMRTWRSMYDFDANSACRPEVE